MDTTERQLIFSILQYLDSVKNFDGINTENLQVGVDCIGGTFSLDTKKKNQQDELSLLPHTLRDIFVAGVEVLRAKPRGVQQEPIDPVIQHNPELWSKWLLKLESKGFFNGVAEGSQEYQNREAKALAKFKEKFGKQTEDQTSKCSKEDAARAADKLKDDANLLMSQKKYKEALDLYTRATELCPEGTNSHVFFSNRAAAETHLGMFTEAITSCEASIALNPKYGKARSRLAYAYTQLGDHESAIDSYRHALELDPQNETLQENLRNSETKNASSGRNAVPQQAPSGGMPDLNNLASMLGGAGGGGFADMMKNPQMQQMAASIMKDPKMMQMAQNVMSNPEMMNQMMSSLGGGGSGMPDVASMMGNNSAPRGDPYTSSATAPNGSPGLFSQEGMAKLLRDPEIVRLRQDPQMTEFFADLERDGPSGAMRHMSNPAVADKLSSVLGKLAK